MSEDRRDPESRQDQIRTVDGGILQSEWRQGWSGVLGETETFAWRRLQRRRRELAEWLIDQLTDASGRLTRSPVDACLGGDDFVPCSFSFTSNGRRFRLDLVSTAYRVVEVEDFG